MRCKCVRGARDQANVFVRACVCLCYPCPMSLRCLYKSFRCEVFGFLFYLCPLVCHAISVKSMPCTNLYVAANCTIFVCLAQFGVVYMLCRRRHCCCCCRFYSKIVIVVVAAVILSSSLTFYYFSLVQSKCFDFAHQISIDFAIWYPNIFSIPHRALQRFLWLNVPFYPI